MYRLIKTKIILCGFSLVEFAEDNGISYDKLNRKLSGKTKINIDDIEMFRTKLNLTQEEIIEIFFPEWLQNMQQNNQ